jgi:hypothetical protein
MVKHCLIRKKVECKNVVGDPVRLSIPRIIAVQYRGTLVSRILAMPRKLPLPFDSAINMVAEKQKEAFSAGQMGSKFGQYCWYTDNFVEWISDLGYHIELTGDEFEPYILSVQVGRTY